jgi:Uma2 family endonuclease
VPDTWIAGRVNQIRAEIEKSDSGHDLVLKRRAYEREGIMSYWLVDPLTPSLTVLELHGGAYVQVARVERVSRAGRRRSGSR